MSLRHRHLIQLGAAVLLAATILGVFALVAWSDQPRVRYASLKCVYRQIYNYRGPVDVVVVGTSRTKWGVSPQTVSTAYGVFLEDKGFATRGTYVIDKEGVIRWMVVNGPGEARSADEYAAALAAIG